MNYGAEPADQVVRYSLEGMEYSLKITGNVAKHVAVFIAAALKDQKKTRGKTRLTRMLKEQRPMKFFTVPGDRLKEFAKEAKARGILYVVIKDKVNPDQTEVMVFADDAAKMNRVLDRMNLDFVKAESGSMVTEAVEKETAPEKAENQMEKEGNRILSHISDSDYVIALAINGKERDSVELAEHIRSLGLHGKSSLAFVIGGSLGLSEEVLKRADEKLSFSKMTFPHQLMRVILAEQIYRSYRIIHGEPYHK